METSPSAPSSHPLSPQRPALIFANWREMLNREALTSRARGTYVEAIACYLDYCHRNGVSVTFESARGFMADAERRRVTDQVELWQKGLNWFFREGSKRGAPQPEGVPTLGRADTGRTPWESRMIERLRLHVMARPGLGVRSPLDL